MISNDIELLKRHQAPEGDLQVDPECFTNWLGLMTDASMFPNVEQLRGRVFRELPASDDGVYGGYAEYASFLTAIEQAPDRQSFRAVELGAGWGPWISGVGKACQRLGFRRIELIGVEADREKCEFMRAHLRRNGIVATVLHGAAWHEDMTLKFPVIHKQDHGAAATIAANDADKDYRGFPQRYVEVPGYSLRTICKGMPIVDYMHWDIQGAELRLAQSATELLNDRARFLFVGTHSRPIEGGLIEFFYRNQWDVLFQRPCAFSYDRHCSSVEGMTTTDGEIFARNPRL